MTQVQEFYTRFYYPNCRTAMLDKRREFMHCSALAPKWQPAGRIFVAGCGTTEAVMVANINPRCAVDGVDFSATSLTIAKAARRKFRIKNLRLKQDNLVTMFTPVNYYDFIVSSGVLHHIPEIDVVLAKLAKALRPDGSFSGMVYSDLRPPIIRDLNKFFREQQFTIEQVMNYLRATENEWFLAHDQSPSEVADTWLHPYFVEYSPDSLESLLRQYFPGKSIATGYLKSDATKLGFIVN